MAGRVRVREISDDQGNRRKRIVRRGAGQGWSAWPGGLVLLAAGMVLVAASAGRTEQPGRQ